MSNNVKGIKASAKRLKMFEYLNSKANKNGIIFLQETHSSIDDEKKWQDEFNGSLFFSHGSYNSCGVAIGFCGIKNIEPTTIKIDKNGRIIILETSLLEEKFVLINLYNSNEESGQLETFSKLLSLIDEIDDLSTKKIILGGDFNLIFDRNLEAYGGNPSLKKKSLTKLSEIIEKLNLCDIWRLRNPKTKRYTFRQNHYSGFIQRRLDFFFISNSLQEQVSCTDVTNAFCTDHSPILFTLGEIHQSPRGRGLWKFNNSLISNEEYLARMKKHITSTLKNLNDEGIVDEQVRWEFLKYEIRKFTRMFSKNLHQKENTEKNSLEKTLKYMEENTKDFQTNSQYLECQSKLNHFYENKVNGIKVRSKCSWYESGEKSSKFFLNLEKHHAIQSQLRKVIVNEKEITSPEDINNEIFHFYKNLFTEKISSSKERVKHFLDKLPLPNLDNQKAFTCEGPITETELLKRFKIYK